MTGTEISRRDDSHEMREWLKSEIALAEADFDEMLPGLVADVQRAALAYGAAVTALQNALIDRDTVVRNCRLLLGTSGSWEKSRRHAKWLLHYTDREPQEVTAPPMTWHDILAAFPDCAAAEPLDLPYYDPMRGAMPGRSR